MPAKKHHLTMLQGGKDADDLIATMLHALKLANSCCSETTYHLLRMALLNEGKRLAKAMGHEPTTGGDSG